MFSWLDVQTLGWLAVDWNLVESFPTNAFPADTCITRLHISLQEIPPRFMVETDCFCWHEVFKKLKFSLMKRPNWVTPRRLMQSVLIFKEFRPKKFDKHLQKAELQPHWSSHLFWWTLELQKKVVHYLNITYSDIYETLNCLIGVCCKIASL